MARAETIELTGETGRGGNGPLSHHNTCRMELPRPFRTWPGLLTTTTVTTGAGTGCGAMHFHHNYHHLHPLQAVCLSYTLPYSHVESQDEPQTHQLAGLSPSLTPPPSPLCNCREERVGGFSGQSDSDREEHWEAYSRQGPMPDLLPQNEHLSWASPHHRAPRGEAVQQLEVRRVANQLRTIGDEFNATVQRRAHAAPHWQDWRDACRGLLSFITQTLSTLYRLT
ncbi:bcl-2-binding component 3 [Chaetodon auriga]|uniref:bcl-2-binding component 3 n=1 Tax=Chaetodon auriga TaxID=39042 RepID=UPI004032B763